MKISIAGDLGSGKSSVAKVLQKELGFSYLSTGQMHRNIAEEYGVNSLELNKIANKDESIDDRIDNYLISLNESSENLIIDSRLAWHFVKDTFKIFLEVNGEIGADRVFGDSGRIGEPLYKDEENALVNLKARKSAENERFFERYNVRCEDLSNYDVVINTSASSIESISILILDLFSRWNKKETYQKFWISPKFVFPTEQVSLIEASDSDSIKTQIENNGLDALQPIDCVEYQEFYFIKHGHRRCSEALDNNIEFIPFYLSGTDDEEIYPGKTAKDLAESSKLSWFKDWEELHKFRFVKYPKLP